MTWRDTLELGVEEKLPGRPIDIPREHVLEAQNVDTCDRSTERGERRDKHVTHDQSPVGIGIDAQMPDSMPRAEDDVITRAGSRDFNDQPGSGGNIAHRRRFF